MMSLQEVAQVLEAEYLGTERPLTGVSIDTRTLSPGDLYVALRGDRFDGHDFIQEATEAGAVAAVVSEAVDSTIPLLKVDNTRQALADLARQYRQKFQIPFIAVTGSCGKTTTRALMAQIFAQQGPVLASIRSFNNDIGVPLTLLQLTPAHQCAVIEMGANHPGEIAFLTHLVRPNVAMITNAAEAHLEGFGDIDGVACAKGEIFQGLSAEGIAIINADDDHADFWRQLAGSRKLVTFGIESPADVMANNIQYQDNGQMRFQLCIGDEQIEIELPLMGLHNVYNALAASAAAYTQQLSLSVIQVGLQSVTAEKRRLVESQSIEGATIIDDSYNANPRSMSAAIQLLTHRGGQRILVIGDMLELGDQAESYHQAVGEQAKQAGINQLYCFGDLTQHAAQAFGKQAHFFKDKSDLIETLKTQLSPEVTVLIKGSHSMGMDQVVSALQQDIH